MEKSQKRMDQERRLEYLFDTLKSGAYHAQFTMPSRGITFSWLIKLIVLLLKPILAVVTPILREELEEVLIKFYHKAIETTNIWDDFLAVLLLEMFDIPVPE